MHFRHQHIDIPSTGPLLSKGSSWIYAPSSYPPRRAPGALRIMELVRPPTARNTRSRTRGSECGAGTIGQRACSWAALCTSCTAARTSDTGLAGGIIRCTSSLSNRLSVSLPHDVDQAPNHLSVALSARVHFCDLLGRIDLGLFEH